ncbi:MAG: CBS domain-containing protein [Acidimicrobiia bacterium]
MRVSELMSTDLATVGADTPLKEAARLMTGRGVSGLPVVDETGQLVGIISESDFVEKASGQTRSGLIGALFEREARLIDADTVGAIMTRSVVSIEPRASHQQAARLMRTKRVKRLPVVNEDGKLVGIVSRSDILGVFARSDATIEHEIRHRLIGQVLAIDGGRVEISVSEGHVELAGVVPTRTDARLLEELSGDVAGVMSVESSLNYLVDDTQRAHETQPYGVPRPNW